MYDDGFWLFAGCDGFYQPAQPDFEQTAIQSVSRILRAGGKQADCSD